MIDEKREIVILATVVKLDGRFPRHSLPRLLAERVLEHMNAPGVVEPQGLPRVMAHDKLPTIFHLYEEVNRARPHGYSFDELLLQLLHNKAAGQCEQCAILGDCTHNAARALLQLIDLHEQGAKYAAGEKQPKAKNINAPKLYLARFDLAGLKASCRVYSCDGIVLIERDLDTGHLNPERVRCILCGQQYTIDTRGLSGWELENMLCLGGREGGADTLISLHEACERSIRYVRRPGWGTAYLETPLLVAGCGPDFTLHTPCVKEHPNTQDMGKQKILYTDLDCRERVYVPCEPEGFGSEEQDGT